MTSPSISGVSSPMPLSPIMSPSESSDQLSVKSRPPFLRMKSMERGISFDTSPHGHQKSYTLKAKHPLFKFRRTNKTFLVGYNDDLESTKAIEWLFDEMIINGDTIVVLQVLDEKQHVSIDKSKVQKTWLKSSKSITISRKFVLSTKPPSVKRKRQSGQPLTNIAHQ